MTRDEFMELPPMEQDELITLNKERKAIVDDYFWNTNLTDDEYIELCQPIYLEQAIEDGIVK